MVGGYYIMTNWGPMKVARGNHYSGGSSSSDVASLVEKNKELEEKLSLLMAIVSPKSGEDKTEAIDTFPEVVKFLKDYKHTETLKEVSNLDVEDTDKFLYEDVF